jgi:hypothetical protein
MHMNAQECVRMHQNTPGTTHILTQEKPSGLKAKLTWTDMGWTGYGRAIRAPKLGWIFLQLQA